MHSRQSQKIYDLGAALFRRDAALSDPSAVLFTLNKVHGEFVLDNGASSASETLDARRACRHAYRRAVAFFLRWEIARRNRCPRNRMRGGVKELHRRGYNRADFPSWRSVRRRGLDGSRRTAGRFRDHAGTSGGLQCEPSNRDGRADSNRLGAILATTPSDLSQEARESQVSGPGPARGVRNG